MSADSIAGRQLVLLRLIDLLGSHRVADDEPELDPDGLEEDRT